MHRVIVTAVSYARMVQSAYIHLYHRASRALVVHMGRSNILESSTGIILSIIAEYHNCCNCTSCVSRESLSAASFALRRAAQRVRDAVHSAGLLLYASVERPTRVPCDLGEKRTNRTPRVS